MINGEHILGQTSGSEARAARRSEPRPPQPDAHFCSKSRRSDRLGRPRGCDGGVSSRRASRRTRGSKRNYPSKYGGAKSLEAQQTYWLSRALIGLLQPDPKPGSRRVFFEPHPGRRNASRAINIEVTQWLAAKAKSCLWAKPTYPWVNSSEPKIFPRRSGCFKIFGESSQQSADPQGTRREIRHLQPRSDEALSRQKTDANNK